MDAKKQKAYKQKLLKEKEALEKEIKKLSSSSYVGYGPNSQEKNMEPECFNNLQIEIDIFTNRVSDIDLALFKIEKNRYDICVVCRNEIENIRLNGDPATELCDMCAEKNVNTEKDIYE